MTTVGMIAVIGAPYLDGEGGGDCCFAPLPPLLLGAGLLGACRKHQRQKLRALDWEKVFTFCHLIGVADAQKALRSYQEGATVGIHLWR